MSEVVISKKWIMAGLLLLALIAGAGLGLPYARRFLVGQAGADPSPTPELTTMPDVDQVARAAVLAGAQAFYTVDYRSQQAWLEKLCALSTQVGCTIDRNALAPSLWPDFVKNQTATTVKASIGDKVLDQTLSGRGVRAQVWRVQIELSAPWPQQAQPLAHFPALSLVIQEGDGWKFERFLTEEETRVYEQGK